VNLYLTQELLANRRGRFLASLLAIEPSQQTVLPESGCVLMTGEYLQGMPALQEECIHWARQPNRTLLLLPPYQAGSVLPSLDWSIEFSSIDSMISGAYSIASILAQELVYQLQGIDGSGFVMDGDKNAAHTRYWKAHSNSGLIAATTLPLWSISLLDCGEKVLGFLGELTKYSGKAAASIENVTIPAEVLQAQDLTVLVCCYCFDVSTAASLFDRLQTYAVPLLNLATFDLPESIRRLNNARFLGDSGLTDTGLNFLRASKFWLFAEQLKGELR
jgi:hypothetical protein